MPRIGAPVTITNPEEISGGGGGGGGAVTVANGADVTQGAIADAAWSGSGNATAIAALKAIALAAQIMDDWDESDRAKVNLIAGQAGVAGGAGAVGATVVRTTQASDSPLVAATGAAADAAWTSGSGSVIALLKAIAAQAISTAPSVVSNSTLSATQLLATGSVSAVGTSALSITVAANSQVVEFYNLSDTVIWLSVTGTAVAATSASIPVPALASGVAGFWVAPPGFVGTISIIAASGSGKAFTCWRYA